MTFVCVWTVWKRRWNWFAFYVDGWCWWTRSHPTANEDEWITKCKRPARPLSYQYLDFLFFIFYFHIPKNKTASSNSKSCDTHTELLRSVHCQAQSSQCQCKGGDLKMSSEKILKRALPNYFGAARWIR